MTDNAIDAEVIDRDGVVRPHARFSFARKLAEVAREEVSGLRPRFLFAQFFVSLLPHNSFNRVRTLLYRMAGLNVGKRALILGKITITGNQPFAGNLTVGEGSRINSPLYIELNAPVTIGREVGIGHHVVLITTDHDTADSSNRSGAMTHSPIVIEDGAWVGAGVMVLPGVTIGAGSVVAAGSMVSQSVPPNKVVGGVPARPIKTLDT